MANQLNETQYTDELRLLVVDHPAAAEVVPDVMGNIHTIVSPVRPTAARELAGSDILDLLTAKDHRCWQSDLPEKNAGNAAGQRTELRIDFQSPKTLGRRNSSWRCPIPNGLRATPPAS